MELNVDTLVLAEAGIGGADVYSYLGFLVPLEDEELLDSVTIYAATSYSAVVALLLVVGYKVREIITEIFLFQQRNDTDLFTEDLENYLAELRRKLEDLVFYKLGFVPTLEELYSTKKKLLVVNVFNHVKGQIEYLSPMTRPGILCTEAVIHACNISLEYMDSTLMNPYPVSYVAQANVLGLSIKRVEKKIVMLADKDSLFSRYVNASIAERVTLEMLLSPQCKHVVVEIENAVGDTEISKRIADLVVKGYNEAREFLVTGKCAQPREQMRLQKKENEQVEILRDTSLDKWKKEDPL